MPLASKEIRDECETPSGRKDPSCSRARRSTGAAVIGLSSPAEACGGFWCSQQAPVDQTGEQIIFVDNPDETVTCIVQIAYAGPSERFAWLLPVGGVPEISVSSNVALQRLSEATRPQYVLERHVDGQCNQQYVQDEGFASGGAAGAPTAGAPGADPGVTVLDQGSVGPYDYATISVVPTLPDPADAAIDWLTSEGYDLTGVDADVLRPYLADGMNLIAFRLTKGNSSGEIRPVVLTYPGDKPSIPIRPTAVAAQDDMGILVWVLGDHQAVPQNYRSLVINEALIDWFSPLSNYNQVVTTAANEAGGQGFVTELADSTVPFRQTVWGENEATGWATLQQQTFADPIDLIWQANNTFRGWDGWREAIEASVTLPVGASIDDFGRNPDAYRGTATVDAALFMELLLSDVVEPVRNTQQLIASRQYITRLYSTMSAGEMTLDPTFTFNPDLAPISNVHTAQLYLQCNPSIFEWEAPWRIMLPRGGMLTGVGQGSAWPLELGGAIPANQKIVQLGETGSGELIEDNSVEILAAIVATGGMNTPPTVSPPSTSEGMPIGGYDQPVNLESDSGGCGCSVPGSSSGSGLSHWAFVAAAAVIGAGRRRMRNAVARI